MNSQFTRSHDRDWSRSEEWKAMDMVSRGENRNDEQAEVRNPLEVFRVNTLGF